MVLLLLRSLLLLGLSLPAIAGVPRVFVSPLDDGVEPGAPPVLAGSPIETLYLYLDAGPVPTGTGTACLDGDGDELCQWEFEVELTGNASVSGFLADPAQDIVWDTDVARFAATGGRATSGELGPIRLGALDLAISGAGWSASISEGSVADAALTHEALTTGVVALPEPGPWALAWGVALIGALNRRSR